MTRRLSEKHLSDSALHVFDQLRRGKFLLRKPGESRLVDRGSTDDQVFETVANEAVNELLAIGWVFPLTQFGHNQRVGWRELVGTCGESWDVYALAQ